MIQAPFLDDSRGFDEQDGSDSRSRRDASEARKRGRYRPAPAFCAVPERMQLIETSMLERNHDRNRDRNA